jgi:hypothetical protein
MFTRRHITPDINTYRVPSARAVGQTLAQNGRTLGLGAAGLGAAATTSYATGFDPVPSMKPVFNPIGYGVDRTMVSALGGDEQVRGMLSSVGMDVPKGTPIGQAQIQQGLAKFNDMKKNNWMMQIQQMWSSLSPQAQQAIVASLGGAAIGGLSGGMPGAMMGGLAGAAAPYAYQYAQGLAQPQAAAN